ncbi:pentapeptide repeat-containing protein [Amycolatopsis roodepoortensis]|uniref:pentapeptide repeat-containing protein n=1 Tax=Amycolatopsis roodepoortensis TaxID=700274 RepID=UPI00214B2660|nr:pentapeptide repeat-containing protein [Amycolatopsis roodepoortensis]UUV30982.1 pentapeptide repeat-containing protein [Amycolatopsis roodepoortensis]
MDFRDFDGIKVRRPSVERDDLESEPAVFRGDFDFDSVRLDGGDQSGVRGGGEIARSVVSDVSLANSRLDRLTLSDVTFEGVDLSNAAIRELSARRVEILRCRAIGLGVAITSATDLYVENGRFDYASVTVERAKGPAVFSGCSFREMVFSGDLSRLTFVDCEFAGTEFAAVSALDCDLRGSRLSDVRGLLTLRGAKITGEQAVSVAGILAAESGLSVVG